MITLDKLSLMGLIESIKDAIEQLEDGETIEQFYTVEWQNDSYSILLNHEIIIDGFETEEKARQFYDIMLRYLIEGE